MAAEIAISLKDGINDLTRQIDSLYQRRQELLQQWAAEVSPWKVGQVTPGRGYSFTGKQVRVLEVKGALDWINGQTPTVKVKAIVLKNDGTDSKNMTDWDYRPKEAE